MGEIEKKVEEILDGILFIPGEAEGAIPNGTEVVKVISEPGDSHSEGDTALVLSSHGPFDNVPGGYVYFVGWDDCPAIPVFIVGYKIKEIKGEQ